jgi:hypothetical protein
MVPIGMYTSVFVDSCVVVGLLIFLIRVGLCESTLPPECQQLADGIQFTVGPDGSSRSGSDCPHRSAFKSLDDISCVFARLEKPSHLPSTSNCLPLNSSFTVHEYPTVPDSQGWAHCRHCVLNDNKFFIVGGESMKLQIDNRVQLSWSYWGEFFHVFQNDKFVGHVVEPVTQPVGNTFYVSRPVYLLPMITMHAGHVLIDYLEQVYFSMIQRYNRVRKDALIVIDVSGEAERGVLQRKLSMYSEGDTFAKLLTVLSDLPIISYETFQQMTNGNLKNGYIIFEDIHFGFDLSANYFNRGYEYHPCVWGPTPYVRNGLFHLYERRYSVFQSYLLKVLNISHAKRSDDDKVSILYIQRTRNRRIMNLDNLVEEVSGLLSSSNGSSIHAHAVVDFDVLSFREQLETLARTDILVAAAGTALHNMLFMKPGSAVVIIMQPGWCKWAWMYANQASLLKIRFILFCTENEHPFSVRSAVSSNIRALLQSASSEGFSYSKDDTEAIAPGTNSFHWTRKYWKQGPGRTKNANITLNLSRLPTMISKVCQQIHIGLNINTVSTDPICISDAMTKAALDTRVMDTFVQHREANQLVYLTDLHNYHAPALELYVSLVELSFEETHKKITLATDDNNLMILKLMGDVVSRYKSNAEYEQLAESLQHLSVCFNSVFTMNANNDADESSVCFELNSFNYYSHLLLRIDSPLHHSHMWLQASQLGGKIKGSDVYVMIDTRLGPDGGLFVHQDIVGQMLIIPPEVLAMARSRNPGIIIPGHHLMSTQYSLQRQTSDICMLVQFSVEDCGYVAENLTRAAYRQVLISKFKLPNIQALPSRKAPFVFIHVEKTAGTTLRELV